MGAVVAGVTPSATSDPLIPALPDGELAPEGWEQSRGPEEEEEWIMGEYDRGDRGDAGPGPDDQAAVVSTVKCDWCGCLVANGARFHASCRDLPDPGDRRLVRDGVREIRRRYLGGQLWEFMRLLDRTTGSVCVSASIVERYGIRTVHHFDRVAP